jgi:hypothetical protein
MKDFDSYWRENPDFPTHAPNFLIMTKSSSQDKAMCKNQAFNKRDQIYTDANARINF